MRQESKRGKKITVELGDEGLAIGFDAPIRLTDALADGGEEGRRAMGGGERERGTEGLEVGDKGTGMEADGVKRGVEEVEGSLEGVDLSEGEGESLSVAEQVEKRVAEVGGERMRFTSLVGG